MRVMTASSTYLLDLAGKTAIRLPGHGTSDSLYFDIADLRRDAEPIPFIGIAQLAVGLPMVLWLCLREDGAPTLRITTPVREIRQ